MGKSLRLSLVALVLPGCGRAEGHPHTEPMRPVPCSWTFPLCWLSGIYLVDLHRADGFEPYVSFVVRDRRAAEILFKHTAATDQAYNRWGAESLYFDGSHTMPNGRAYKTSFN